MSQPFLGEIRLFPWNWAPRGWHLCDGSLLPISQYAALFSLLGVNYGGNGSTSFGLPDMRGRAPIHFSGQYPQGLMMGTESVTLNTTQLPQHTHALQGINTNATAPEPSTHYYGNYANATAYHYTSDANPLTLLNPTTVSMTGSNLPHDNMQPFLALNYSIALSGAFPSRN